MTAAILSIGTELTRGELVNTNATWLADQLTRLDQAVQAIAVVPDDSECIQRALAQLGEEHRLVLCTGGLGPTTDDITAACVAELQRVPLVRDEVSLAAIRDRLQHLGRALAASNARQADLPRGAEVLPNPVGTAPGFAVQLGQARAFFLPGVPREMQVIFTQLIAPRLRGPSGRRSHQVRIRTFGLPESEVNDRLAGIESDYGVTLGYRAHLPEVEVKVLAWADTPEQAESCARRAADAVRSRLGPTVVWGEGDVTIAESLGGLLRERQQRIALAESCTGGMVGRLLTDTSGSSDYFVGGAVTYSNAAKEKVLGVEPSLLAERGAVSAEVAGAMAQGALALFGADLALSLTGIAGPTGGTTEKPVGLVYCGVATREGTAHQRLTLAGNRASIRRRAAFAGLALARNVLLLGLRAAAR